MRAGASGTARGVDGPMRRPVRRRPAQPRSRRGAIAARVAGRRSRRSAALVHRDSPPGDRRRFHGACCWKICRTVYRQLEAQQPVQLPAKTSAFKDWAARLQAYAGSESLREELGWWQAQLAGPSAELPCDRPRRWSAASPCANRQRAPRQRAHPAVAATGAECLSHPGQRPAADRVGPCAVPLERSTSRR